ncbi:MAG: type II toxin-antitoxin system RelE/ParE family toxin [Candidatus Omnitrophica bacterium]|nr:type II toxin-antitoxin system RelE/ParE family toxin [Candidatus Omnitrophota bacterium]
MFYLKTKYFARWARKEGITDGSLRGAIREFESGLCEANLGNHLFKKRLALPGKGKSSGARTILFYQKGKKLIFCFGFSKSEQDNLSDVQVKVLNKLSNFFQNINDEVVMKNIKHNELIGISGMEVRP